MPVQYHCDNCEVTAESLAGWTIVSVSFLHDDQTSTSPPYSRMLDVTVADLLFHAVACRDAWCAAAKIAPPTIPAHAQSPMP